ncbi:hypothetical protein [Meiothermus phage MMP17]|nr:hypothetical protein [Meiothermus phage MMP17]
MQVLAAVEHSLDGVLQRLYGHGLVVPRYGKIGDVGRESVLRVKSFGHGSSYG